jgi:hypothetical protein
LKVFLAPQPSRDLCVIGAAYGRSGIMGTDPGNTQQTGDWRENGPDKFGGTRAGAENVEAGQRVTNIEKGTDVDKVAGVEEKLDDSVSLNGPTERAPERDERGRI